ncbi:MAG: cyclic nucleotide-binding/CBS domain-containing protein [Desulfomonile tiedjei]|uniref:Cyclic nucleotide-binding/CBS domain-containing protein n=1 Tax=Desulfomonile tiedjei TaxID=2358 RepID=A0A9D6V0V7_9BACT|nr:cyclic nucleotide-binding/CBS domain-containing protein [Desulfomonile tiedjei]
MAQKSQSHEADPEAVVEFLQRNLPFKELDSETLTDLARRCTIDFFPKDTLILHQDVSEVTHLYLIQRGGVKVYLTDSDGAVTLKDFRGEGGYFGALGIIRGSKANLNVETVEDTFCFLLEKEALLSLIQNNPQVAQYYLKQFSEDVVCTAYNELRSRKVKVQSQNAFYLFSLEIQDVIKRVPEIVHCSQTIQQAAARMSELAIGSVLVQDQSGDIGGIVTDKDLRAKVVAMGTGYDAPVATIMSSPLKTISAHSVCFDALLQMMNEQVHHLAVERAGEIIGVVTSHDIMVHQGTSPLYLFREIVAQRKIEGLYSLSQKVPLVVRGLIEEGAKANNITRMITVLNDHIVYRLLTLLHEEMGPEPYPFCWLMLGSEGRKEQTFKTDQDNALIYQTPAEDWEEIKTSKLYFRRFGNRAIQHLEACGYPLCKGEMMASNPKWRKPFAVWRDYFDRWISAPEPEEVLNATIFFDFRPGYGQVALGERLRDFLAAQAPKKGIFLMHLAKDCLQSRPPLTFFRNFVVEKDGKYKNRLDIKTRGLVPFVDFARLLSLKHGVRETNTLDRLQALADRDCISRELYTETREAYEFQMQLRLVHQLRMMESGQVPHNHVDPGELSELEKQTLRESFAVIGRIQAYVKDEFRVVE